MKDHKIEEARNVLPTAASFDSPADRAKRQSRTAMLWRIIDQAEKAADKAEQLGKRDEAETLRERAKELQALAEDKVPDDEEPSRQSDQDNAKGKDDEKNANEKPNDEELDLDAIIDMLKPLTGSDRSDATRALQDLLSESLTEALRPLPKKSLMELSNDEFNDIINNVLDEIDSIDKLDFVDPIDRQTRIEKIKDDNSNVILNRALEREDSLSRQGDKEHQALKARDKEKGKYRNYRSISQFKIDFWRAIRDQVQKQEEKIDTPLQINQRYESEDIIKNGERYEDKWTDEKPRVDLFFDMSGSWFGDKTAIDIGKQAVKTIKEFEDKNEIELNVYYFSDILTTSMDDPALDRGTSAWNDIIAQIQTNKTNNVVLMTDSDMSGYAARSPKCVVDGCVWIIWRNGDSSEEIASHLVGKLGNMQYSFKSSDY